MRESVHKALGMADMALRFDRGAVLTTGQLVSDYGVAKRTINRWIADVSSYLLPLDYMTDGAHHRYYAAARTIVKAGDVDGLKRLAETCARAFGRVE